MEEIKRITKELIEIESTETKPEKLLEIIDYVKKQLPNFKFKEYEKKDIPSILFYNDEKGLTSGFKVILNGHLDVIKGTPDQFKPEEKDGKIYGRGSADMKSGCAVILVLFNELASQMNYPIGLLFNGDEETGGFNGALHCAEDLKSEIVLAAEPTKLEIGRRAKGVCWLQISAKGSPAHGAHLWDGDNAMEKVVEAVNTIKKNSLLQEEKSGKQLQTLP